MHVAIRRLVSTDSHLATCITSSHLPPHAASDGVGKTSHSAGKSIKTKLYCSISVYDIITAGFMSPLSPSFAVSAEFPHSWVSLQEVPAARTPGTAGETD